MYIVLLVARARMVEEKLLFVVVVAVLTLTRIIIKSVVTGRATVTLES